MATTIRYEVPTWAKRDDSTYNVKMRVTHQRTTVRIGTSIYVPASLVTPKGHIKDPRIAAVCDSIVAKWRGYIIDLGEAAQYYSVHQVVDYIRQREAEGLAFKLDFVDFMREVASSKRPSSRHNYLNAATSLARYAGASSPDVADITSLYLTRYEAWMRHEELSPNTIYLYMSLIKAAHAEAKFRYNDEDKGIIRIPQSPFSKYRMPSKTMAKPRSVDLDTLQAIADLPNVNRVDARRNLGRNLFMLSFALGGMNVADIYNLPYDALRGDVIEYCRQKTRRVRIDEARYRVRIEPEVRAFVHSFIDPSKHRLFSFYESFSQTSLLEVVARAMRSVEAAVPYSRHYTFYSARHTYATIARNVVGLDKYTVHELLNHSDSEMRITDRYIERDWQRLYDAHRRIVTLIDWTRLSSSALVDKVIQDL